MTKEKACSCSFLTPPICDFLRTDTFAANYLFKLSVKPDFYEVASSIDA
jgi:hypothetical protein